MLHHLHYLKDQYIYRTLTNLVCIQIKLTVPKERQSKPV